MNITDAISTIKTFDNIAEDARAIALANARPDRAALASIRFRLSITFLSSQQQQQVAAASEILVSQKAVAELIKLLVTDAGRLAEGRLAREVAITVLGQIGSDALNAVPALVQTFARAKSNLLQAHAAQNLHKLRMSVDKNIPANSNLLSELVNVFISQNPTEGELDIQTEALELLTLFSLEKISLDSVKSLVEHYGKPDKLAQFCSYHEKYVQFFFDIKALKFLSFMIDHGNEEEQLKTVSILQQLKQTYEISNIPEDSEQLIDSSKDVALDVAPIKSNVEKLLEAARQDNMPIKVRELANNNNYTTDCTDDSSPSPKRRVDIARYSHCKEYVTRRKGPEYAEMHCSGNLYFPCRTSKKIVIRKTRSGEWQLQRVYRWSRSDCIQQLRNVGSTWNPPW